MSIVSFVSCNILYDRFRFLSDGDRFMSLKNLSYRTESLLNIIINKLIKEGKWIEGKPWISITQIHLSKILKCTRECVSNHICKLVEEGILLREQLSAKDYDHRNYYSINPAVLEDLKWSDVFSRTIVKKIRSIYSIINNKSFNKSINQHESKSVDVLPSDMATKPSKAVANPPTAKPQDEEKHPEDSSQTKPTIVQDMLEIWRKEINKDECIKNKKTACYLVACYKEKFDSSLEKWTEYVKGLKNSKYISELRKRWRSILMWALSFKVINRIFDGGFGVAFEDKTPIKPENSEYYEHCIDSLSEHEECKAIRRGVLKEYGEAVYRSWFTNLSLEKCNREILVKGSAFQVDWVINNYLDTKHNFVASREFYMSDKNDEIAQPKIVSANGYVGTARINALLAGRL